MHPNRIGSTNLFCEELSRVNVVNTTIHGVNQGRETVKYKLQYSAYIIVITFAGMIASTQAETLDIKPGLWEMTAHTQAHGQLPIPEEKLKQMSPQQREAIEKMMARATAPKTRIYKSCITKEKLEKGQTAFLEQRHGMKCENKLTKHTRSAIAGSMHCNGPGIEETGEFSTQAKDREHMAGKMNIKITNGSRTMTSQGDFSSHWVSASCGDVK